MQCHKLKKTYSSNKKIAEQPENRRIAEIQPHFLSAASALSAATPPPKAGTVSWCICGIVVANTVAVRINISCTFSTTAGTVVVADTISVRVNISPTFSATVRTIIVTNTVAIVVNKLTGIIAIITYIIIIIVNKIASAAASGGKYGCTAYCNY